MTTLLLAVVAWRFVRRLAAAAIIIALAALALRSGSFAHHASRDAGAVERVVRPIEHALGRALRR